MNAMKEALKKKHELHVKITLEPNVQNPHNDMHPIVGETHEEHIKRELEHPEMQSEEEEEMESPELQRKEEEAGLESHLTHGMREVDEDMMMKKEPKDLHARVVKNAILKKKGK